MPIFSRLLVFLPVVLACLLPSLASSQYFLSGKITNDIEQPLPGVSITLKRTGKVFTTDSTGAFKIPVPKKGGDTLIFKRIGHDSLKTFVQTGVPALLQLLPVAQPHTTSGVFLSSLTRNLVKDPVFIRHLHDETYRSLVENNFVKANRFSETGFTLNVNKAAYSNIRRFINNQTIMPIAAVRIEEMLNYFSLGCTQPPVGKEVFGIETRLSTCPWNAETLLLFINVQARKLNMEKVPPGNLVFLIDDSGSMDMPNRLPLLQSAFKMLVANLRAEDTVSIVTYGESAGVWLSPTGGAQKQKLIESIESIRPGGVTPGASGIRLAYQMAEKTFKPGANNRVILATDGDFNVGIKDEKELENFITRYRNSGIYLTCLGVGVGNYKDSKLEALARYGRGNFAYLDNEQEAQKVLVKEFTQTAITVAEEVLMNIEFNAAQVDEYRLIGFDNSQAALSDPSSILQGGDIGSGHSQLALFEIKPLRKTTDLLAGNNLDEIATLRLQYRRPDKRSMEYKTQTVIGNLLPFDRIDPALRFATSVAMLGQLLRRSPFSQSYVFNDVSAIATSAANPADALQQEFIRLIGNAKKIYEGSGKKKKKD